MFLCFPLSLEDEGPPILLYPSGIEERVYKLCVVGGERVEVDISYRGHIRAYQLARTCERRVWSAENTSTVRSLCGYVTGEVCKMCGIHQIWEVFINCLCVLLCRERGVSELW